MVKKRRRHTAAYKFRIALEALEGSKTISQSSSEHEIHANLIRTWKRQLLEDGPSAKGSAWLGPRSSTLPKAHSSRPMPSPPACSQPTFKTASTAASVWMHLFFPVSWSKHWDPPKENGRVRSSFSVLAFPGMAIK